MAALFHQYMDQLEKQLQEKNKLTEGLQFLETKTGVKKLYLAAGGIAVIALWLIFGYGAQLLCNLIGFGYPAYASVKAIESTQTADDTKWLMYWVVFAVFSVAEFFSDILLNWFPLYWLAKCVFLIWCFAPISANGTNFIYSKFVRPFFLKHQGVIDNTLHRVGDMAEKAVEKAAASAAENARKQD